MLTYLSTLLTKAKSLKKQPFFLTGKAPDSRRCMEKQQVQATKASLEQNEDTEERSLQGPLVTEPKVAYWKVIISLILLFLNYFLAQYDKFVLSYFQKDVIASLHLSSSEYGLLSGYATGIVYALLALPTAYVADYTRARVWVLTVAAVWWSLCAIFQGLSHNFWQILLARIGMGIGQAPVEALSVSLISDLMGKQYVFFGERYVFSKDAPILKLAGNH